MTVQLLTEHHLEFLSLKRDCTGSSESTCQNATLLEITCHGSYMCNIFGGLCEIGPLSAYIPVCVHDNNSASQVTDGIVYKLIDDPPGFHVTSSSRTPGNHVDSQQVCYQRLLLVPYTNCVVGLGSCIGYMRARPVYSLQRDLY